MKSIKIPVFIFFALMYVMISVPFVGCNPDDPDDCDDECDTCTMLYKPNIYIYPTAKTQLGLKLSFPLGGHVVTSIPEYGAGWNFTVDTTGLINNTYTYLFYESTQPDIWQDKQGWAIGANELEPFFRKNMADYGFEGHEIDDFIDYWIPRLNSYPYYSICPQTSTIINNVVQLHFTKQPDNILRLFYVIKGHNQLPVDLTTPSITCFGRDGYFATEWGVILE